MEREEKQEESTTMCVNLQLSPLAGDSFDGKHQNRNTNYRKKLDFPYLAFVFSEEREREQQSMLKEWQWLCWKIVRF